jgi:hypothetical protein
LLDNGLLFFKIDDKIVLYHQEGRLKTLTIQRDTVGNWYVCLACEVEPAAGCNDLQSGSMLA